MRTLLLGILLYPSLLFSVTPASVPCPTYTFEKISQEKLDPELYEMSGLIRLDDGRLVHVQDSGNDPFLIVTKSDGAVIERIRYADVATDPEELARGQCPWSKESCLYILDTGDNFRLRGQRNIWAVDETSLKTPKPRIENINFTFPGGERVDSEAAALVGRTFYLFAKERKHARVFALDLSAWEKGSREAKLITDLPYTMLTGASASADGERILLLNWQGVIELAKSGTGPKAAGEFYPYRRKIKIKTLSQQEAVAYDEDQRSFLYSSEKKVFSKDDWGIVRARCAKP